MSADQHSEECDETYAAMRDATSAEAFTAARETFVASRCAFCQRND